MAIPGNTVRGKPVVGKPKVGSETDAPVLKLPTHLFDPFLEYRTFDSQA